MPRISFRWQEGVYSKKLSPNVHMPSKGTYAQIHSNKNFKRFLKVKRWSMDPLPHKPGVWKLRYEITEHSQPLL